VISEVELSGDGYYWEGGLPGPIELRLLFRGSPEYCLHELTLAANRREFRVS